MSYVSKATPYGSERQIWPTPVYPTRGVRGMDAYVSKYEPSAVMPPGPPPSGFGAYVDYGTPAVGVTGAVNQVMSTFTGMSDALKIGLVGVGAYLLATKTKIGKRMVGVFK